MNYRPDLLIVGDLHLRDDQPLCRTDDFWETQLNKLMWLRKFWIGLGRPRILQPGDVFHRWRSSPQVITLALEKSPPMICVPGNHDLPNHSLQGWERSALYTVEAASDSWMVLTDDRIQVNSGPTIVPFPWGSRVGNASEGGRDVRVAVVHDMVLDGGEGVPAGMSSTGLLSEMDGYSLIVTGHNHRQFVREYRGRHLINPGSFTRQTSAEAHSPAVYLWWMDGIIERIPIPHDPDAVSREHIRRVEERDGRLEAFVESLLEDQVEVAVSFVSNVTAMIQSPGVREAVRRRVEEAIRDEG